MIEIRTISDFLGLSTNHRTAILRSLRTKDRLEDWIASRNKKRGGTGDFWFKCPRCKDSSRPGEIYVARRDGSDIHPSQIHRCLRKIWYDCNGYADQGIDFVPPRLQMIFDMGSAWHEVMQTYGAKGAWGGSGIYRAEVGIDPDARDANGYSLNDRAEANWIKGHADAVLDLYQIEVEGLGPVSIRVVHEYKTINSGGFSRLTKPKTDHKWQASLYSYTLDIPVVVYLYTNKDNCQTKDFPVPFDQAIWNTIEEKIEKVQHYTGLGSPPDWPETAAVQNPAECKECPYLRTVCKPPIKG